MNISNFFQFILGFILGVFLLMVGSVGAAYYFFNRMAAAPPKPTFAETVAEPETPTRSENGTPLDQDSVSPSNANSASPAQTAAEPKEEETMAAEDLPEGAYQATVTWSGGLSLRAEPSQDSSRLGGIDYNAEVTVLGMSADGTWQQIRLEDGTEAWVKAGNLQKVN